MTRTRFGTDGVRGIANVDLTPEFVVALGRAVARTITAPTFVVGRDTRKSGPMLQAALSAGLASEGADVVDVGVLPTPALAWLSAIRTVRRPSSRRPTTRSPTTASSCSRRAARSSPRPRRRPSRTSSSASSIPLPRGTVPSRDTPSVG